MKVPAPNRAAKIRPCDTRDIGIKAFGETKSAIAWSTDKRCAVRLQTLCDRLRRGVPPESAISVVSNGKLPQLSKRWARDYASKHDSPRLEIDWDRVRVLYLDRKLDVRNTARALGVNYGAVQVGLKRRGWFRKPPAPARSLKHGLALQAVWGAMRKRCTSPRDPDYRQVGARGIRVDAAWPSFAEFHAWALRSGYREGLVLTRKNRDKSYGPRNCVWLSRRDAMRLHRPAFVMGKGRWTITAFGETKGVVAWARDARCTVGATGLVMRLKRGMRAADAITAPNASAMRVTRYKIARSRNT